VQRIKAVFIERFFAIDGLAIVKGAQRADAWPFDGSGCARRFWTVSMARY
jgi:hypothetical protein